METIFWSRPRLVNVFSCARLQVSEFWWPSTCIYNPGQNSFEHLLTNDGNRKKSQDCHRKTSSPLSPPDQCWFEKWNANLTWYKWSSTLIWVGGISIYKNKFDVRINCTPVVPMILARIVVHLTIHTCIDVFYTIVRTRHKLCSWFAACNWSCKTSFTLCKHPLLSRTSVNDVHQDHNRKESVDPWWYLSQHFFCLLSSFVPYSFMTS